MIDWDAALLAPCVGVFGEPVTYTEPGHAPQSLTGIFDVPYKGVTPMGGGPNQEGQSIGAPGVAVSRAPTLGVQLSQFRYPPSDSGATVYIPRLKAAYTVRSVKPDGMGMAILTLTAAGGR